MKKMRLSTGTGHHTAPPARLTGTVLGAVGLLAMTTLAGFAVDFRGMQFLGFKDFSAFESSAGEQAGELTMTSPEIRSDISWDELVASWNVELPEGAYSKIEVRGIYPGGPTKYYVMGLWSGDPKRHPRESVPHQKDARGDVSTDTLVLKEACDRFQVRLTLGGDTQKPKMKFLGICLTHSKATPAALPPNKAAWGKTISVPERSQMAYPNGGVLCSPTTVSMMMTYWSQKLERPELDHDVPEIVKAIYDPKWKGTGNWPFNTAYAGSYPGMRAYVTRLTDLAEVEDWVAAGFPVGLSVCSDRLHRRGPGPNGHLIVCCGFTKDGDPVVNDPGSLKRVRRVYSRPDLIYAWAYSHNTAYIIYPEQAEIPPARLGHWDSERLPTKEGG